MIGRWTTVDPLAEKFYQLTPYQGFSNNPATNVDLEGLEGVAFQAVMNYIMNGAANPNSTNGKVAGAMVGVVSSVKNAVTGLNPIPMIMRGPPSMQQAAQDGVNGGLAVADRINKIQNGNGFDQSSAIAETVTDVAIVIATERIAGKLNGGTKVNGPSGLGDLTTVEVNSIQKVVDEAGRPLDVAGSAASSKRRGIGTKRPIGKGDGTKSDIDYLAPPSSQTYFQGLEGGLPGLDPATGIIPGQGNPYIGPFIKFEPNGRPTAVPKQN